MILFNNSGGRAFPGGGIWSGNIFKTDNKTESNILRALLGEERPGDMLGLLTILVLLLHAFCISWLLRPVEREEPITPPKVIEMAMITLASPKPAAAPKPAPPQPVKKPEPKKPQPKPLPLPKKAPPPVVQKSPDFAPVEPAAPAPAAQPSSASPAPVKAEESQAEPITEAKYKADYLNNPHPPYPAVALSRGWHGKVSLRVRVSIEGLPEKIEVEHSSGHDILDEAAMEAVEKWKFVPAKRGATAIVSSVIVPINFRLDE